MKKTAVFLFWTAILLILPTSAGAQVIINEIMYDLEEGGDTGREWIEIYNTGGDVVDLTGWKFFEANVNHGLILHQGSAALVAGGYAVIVDNPEKFLADWPGSPSTIFDSSFSLNNTGETLVLKNTELVVVDEVIYSSDWGAAGDGNSLQKNSGEWVATGPTPGAVNSSSGSPPADDGGGSGGGGEEVVEPAESEAKPPLGRLKVSLAEKKQIVAVGSSILFRANASGGGGVDPRFVWTFGDGSTATGQKVEHIYKFPGNHTVVLNAFAGEEQATARGNVKVFQPEIIVTEVQAGPLDDSYIQMENRSAYEVNLGSFRLEVPASPAGGSGGSFIFPSDTIVASKTKINFPAAITRLAPDSPAAVRIIYPNGRPVLAVETPRERQDIVSTSMAASSREAVLAQMQTKVLRLADEVKKLKPPDFETQPSPPTTLPATTSLATTTVLELPRPSSFLNRGFGFIKNIFSGND